MGKPHGLPTLFHNNAKHKQMRLIFMALAYLLAFDAIAQTEHDFGVLVRGNIATQTNFDPSKPDDGTFQWNSLTTFGIGAYASRQIKGRFHVCAKLMFLQKGFKELSQFGIVFTPIYDEYTFQNRFNYISADLLGKYYFSMKNNRPYAHAGIQSSFLVSEKVESDSYPFNEVYNYPISEYGNYKLNTFSWILGFGLEMNKTLSIEAEVNRDFTPVLKKDNLLVKNWLWSLSMQVSLYNILKKK